MAESGQITNNNKRGTGDIYQASTPFNAHNQQINSVLQKINTVFLGRIISVKSGGVNGSKTVTAQPLICQIDANGNALPSPKLVEIPHYRVQAGTGAIILDPKVGDIGVFVCCKRDSSNVKNGVSDPQVPASFRSFDLADSIMIATIHTGAADTYIHIIPENGEIIIKAPSSLTVNTAAATINASGSTAINSPETTISGHVTIRGGLSVSGGEGAQVDGSISASGDITGGNISLQSHRHSGVQAGGSNTGTPV